MLAVALLWLCCDALSALEPGEPVPDCPTLRGLANGASLSEAINGKVAVIDFWASWCTPCRRLMPFLNELHEAHRAEGLTIVAINLDDEQADAERFLTRVPVGYPVAFDAAGECPARFALKGMPSTFVIDRQGIVRHVNAGFRTRDRTPLVAAIKELLDE